MCARVQLTRFRPARRRAGGVRFTRLRRKAKHHLFSAITLPKALLPPDSIVLLQLRRIRNTYRITGLICGRQSGGCEEISIFHGSAARRAHGSSAEHAMRDLIASNAPLRNGSHKARQNGPKHYPGDSRGRSPLARLSPLSFVVQRKMGPPEVVGCRTRRVKTCNERWGHRRSSDK